MNRLIKFFLILTITSLFSVTPFQVSNADEPSLIVENGVSLINIPSQVDGKISISGQTTKQKIKALIIKDTYQEWFDIDLENGKFNEDIWLTEGKGQYDVNIMVNLEDRKYTYGPKIHVENVSEVNRFLVPTKDVESNDPAISDLAKRLTRLSKTDRDKARNIYNWITRNIKYDYDKYRRQLANDYTDIYGATNTFKTKKGVCYDFSTLFAAMSRSIGLEAKVIRGNYVSGKRQEYHAWNEIHLKDEGKWIKLDSTFGYALNKNYFDNKDFDDDHVKIDEM
ncbi:transglutaminase-like domain-containing protein [Pseudobacteroides cellulosolvens]|uniref:Transglutaminase domain-containing protein n=1 Tax=Pseudobacteroides cellulosolvens ATCC 35603 = DSM 2933 TaxID=398512 RepID=A0A0L6JRQ1_9FIRM|nr:transglutaminase-like domain-containing protein [Pseudobacteroides cellulosolvens]KNY28463.1 transglutaminase domain-containing protein [Pseudobacteroides cellulosolvens ATCC 35603 = DSM 2933]